MESNEKVLKIQKCFRGFLARCYVIAQLQSKLALILREMANGPLSKLLKQKEQKGLG